MLLDAKHRPEGAIGGSDIAGIRNATSGSLTDKLTREHRMTLDEAHLILNTKKEESLEKVLQVRCLVYTQVRADISTLLGQHYEHLFKANSPPAVDPAPAAKPRAGVRQSAQPSYSHYLQSKVVRARERIEAEHKTLLSEDSSSSQAAPPPPSQNPPPPPSEGGKSG